MDISTYDNDATLIFQRIGHTDIQTYGHTDVCTNSHMTTKMFLIDRLLLVWLQCAGAPLSFFFDDPQSNLCSFTAVLDKNLIMGGYGFNLTCT